MSLVTPGQAELDAAMQRWKEAEEAGGVEGVSRDKEGRPLNPLSLIDRDKLLYKDSIPYFAKVRVHSFKMKLHSELLCRNLTNKNGHWLHCPRE